jgi:hypothetical protein
MIFADLKVIEVCIKRIFTLGGALSAKLVIYTRFSGFMPVPCARSKAGRRVVCSAIICSVLRSIMHPGYELTSSSDIHIAVFGVMASRMIVMASFFKLLHPSRLRSASKRRHDSFIRCCFVILPPS